MGVRLQILFEDNGGGEKVTLRNFEMPDELWDEFLEAIDGRYASASEALRDLMRQFIRKRKEAST